MSVLFPPNFLTYILLYFGLALFDATSLIWTAFLIIVCFDSDPGHYSYYAGLSLPGYWRMEGECNIQQDYKNDDGTRCMTVTLKDMDRRATPHTDRDSNERSRTDTKFDRHAHSSRSGRRSSLKPRTRGSPPVVHRLPEYDDDDDDDDANDVGGRGQHFQQVISTGTAVRTKLTDSVPRLIGGTTKDTSHAHRTDGGASAVQHHLFKSVKCSAQFSTDIFPLINPEVRMLW